MTLGGQNNFDDTADTDNSDDTAGKHNSDDIADTDNSDDTAERKF